MHVNKQLGYISIVYSSVSSIHARGSGPIRLDIFFFFFFFAKGKIRY